MKTTTKKTTWTAVDGVELGFIGGYLVKRENGMLYACMDDDLCWAPGQPVPATKWGLLKRAQDDSYDGE